MQRQDVVWQNPRLVRTFINDVRGGVPYAADQLEMMLRVISAQCRAIDCFADLGCGSGVLARVVLSRFPEARAVLIDFSEAMLEEARLDLGGHVPAPVFAVGDMASAAWSRALQPHSPVDLIVSGYAIHHLPHERKRRLYGEIFELLAPGGLFVNVEHVASATARVEAMSDELMVDTISAFQERKGSGKSREEVRREFVHRPDKAANILAPVEEQCRWLRDIGFEDVDCFFKVFELAVFGGRRPN